MAKNGAVATTGTSTLCAVKLSNIIKFQKD